MQLLSQPIRYIVAPPPPPGGEQDASAGPGGRGPDHQPQHLRLLIVEDDAFVALDAKEILEGAGHAVVGLAKSADEAVDLAGKTGPDLILMDIRLLGSRDGIDAAIEIRERYGLRCIFASAFSDAKTRDRADDAHPLAFLSKPVTRKTLLDAIAKSAGEL